MKSPVISILFILIPLVALADEQQTPSVSSACQIRSQPGAKNGSTVEYSWKIISNPVEDRVLSVDHLTWDPKLGARGVSRHFEYCKPGRPHQQDIVLKVGLSPDDGKRACWFGGLVQNDGLVTSLSESAAVSVTTQQVSSEGKLGHLIGVTVSDRGRELRRHFIFVSFISPAELQRLLPSDLGEKEREARDGNEWQIFTDPKTWKPTFSRFLKFEK